MGWHEISQFVEAGEALHKLQEQKGHLLHRHAHGVLYDTVVVTNSTR
jgi:hypothetical protein